MKYLLIILIVLVTVSLRAQWKMAPIGGVPLTIYTNDTEVFVSVGSASNFSLEEIDRFVPRTDRTYILDTTHKIDGSTCLAVVGPYMFASQHANQIYRSSDHGITWAYLKSALLLGGSYAFGVIDTILITTEGYRTTDYGNTWTHGNKGSFRSFITAGPWVYATPGLSFSTDSGATWTGISGSGPVVPNYPSILAGTDFYGGGPSLAYSSDTGQHWIDLSSKVPGTGRFTGLASAGANAVFVGSDGGGVAVSTDRGGTWIARNEGLPYTNITAMAICDSFLLIGVQDGSHELGEGVWFRPLSELIGSSAVEQASQREAEALSVYPNPVGSNCTISFSLATGGLVRITLMDLMGRAISVPFEGMLGAGNHLEPLDASHLPDGTYWCRLEAEGTQRVAKITIIR